MRSSLPLRSSLVLATLVSIVGGGCAIDDAEQNPVADLTAPLAAGTTFAAVADAEVSADEPTKSFGRTTTLRSDGAPQFRSYLRFVVSGLSGPVTSAKVRCYTTNPSTNAPAIYATSNAWNESTLTWNNRPAQTGNALSDVGNVAVNSWLELDVKAKVTGNGSYDFVLVPTSNDAISCASRESASNRPQLVVTTDVAPPPPPPATAYGIGTYMGSFSTETFKSTFGAYADVETIYLDADRTAGPDVAKHEAQIDLGVSPVIDIAFKRGPFTLAQIAAWGTDVAAYFQTFTARLQTLSAYAKAKNNGTRVYFSFEHEAVVKINQKKYDFAAYGAAGVPTVADSAAAWNKVTAWVAAHAPDVVRLFWYGGSGQNEDVYAAALTPSLVQMATFDPYRWSHNRSTDTAQSLWGSMITHLKSQPFMKNADGSLKPWGLTEWGTDASFGDAGNATFVSQTISYLKSQGAAFTVYFDRAEGANDFVFTDGGEPATVAAYKAAVLAN